ncbi:GNAT family N-acetyltransferase [uncultured Cellulomonas sp.]|uniref:GNAT family N-acetyltransferase n=1 Tax=uncultured Cellulomonas sp. TaxID=189682 RepID=UPI0026365437|nr:GNAT family N-acetyltransferase [uncultured Cellulomonas sp.]
MDSEVVVRSARLDDAFALARVHVGTWRETYRGVMRDVVLEAPDFIARREQFRTTVLSDARFDGGVAVAERDDEIVGIALAGPATGDDARRVTQLYVLYTYLAVHGSGVGSALLAAVFNERTSSALWVAEPNSRAHAFYRKHGFVRDGTIKVDDGVLEVRMVRPAGVSASTS